MTGTEEYTTERPTRMAPPAIGLLVPKLAAPRPAAPGYHLPVVARFLLFALLLLTLSLGLYAFALDTFGATAAARAGIEGFDLASLSPILLLAGWLLEALALTALFLLLLDRTPSRWLDGLATAWIAWIFRGPLLALAIATATHLDPAHWWRIALGWLPIYTLCGVLLAGLGRRLGERS